MPSDLRTRPRQSRRWPPGSARHLVPGQGELRDPDGLLLEKERQTAEWLAQQGHIVQAVPRGPRKTPDIVVDGVPIELKHPTGPTGGLGPTSQTVTSQLRRSDGQQSVDVLFDVRRTGMPEREARRSLIRAFPAFQWLRSLRIVGDGFDLFDVVER